MKNIYYILLCLLPINFIAQDIHFTQTVFTPQIINPATVGLFDGWERITLSHRQQWIGINNPYITSQFSLDMNLLKKDDGTKKSYLGLGLAFYNDIAGDSKFGINQINLSVASIIPIAEKHTISSAIQIGGVQRSGNLDGLTWANQFEQSSNSFNTEIDPNESNGMSSFFHEDFGAGTNNFLGDEFIFISQACRAGLKCEFLPLTIAVHPSTSSGMIYGTQEDTKARSNAIQQVFGKFAMLARLGFVLKNPLRFKSFELLFRFIFRWFPEAKHQGD